MSCPSARFGSHAPFRSPAGLRPVLGLLIGLVLPGAAAIAGPQSIRPMIDATAVNAEYAEALEDRFRAACEALEERAACQRRLEALQAELGFDGFALVALGLASPIDPGAPAPVAAPSSTTAWAAPTERPATDRRP